MRVRRSYVAIYLQWLSQAWSYEEVCVGVEETRPPRNGECYQAVFLKVLEDNQLSAKHLVCAVSDHEGSIRRGFRLMGLPLVGCGCHALQLTVKHFLPPLKTRQAASVSSSSSSDSSSDDGSCASSEEDEPARARGRKQDPAADDEPGRARGRKRDPAAVKLQTSLKPFFKKMRAVVSHYKHNSDDFVTLQNDCKSTNIVCKAYASETPTRWSSSLTSLTSVLVNNRGHVASRHVHKTKAPPGFGEEDIRLGLELCALLQPIKHGTKLLEAGGEKALASMYVPTWHSVGAALAKTRFSLPKDLHGLATEVDITVPLAAELQKFLREDLNTVKARHLQGTAGENLLLAAPWLDPRFKSHPSLDQRAARKVCRTLALDLYKSFPELRQALAEHPDEQVLESLVHAKPKRRKKTPATPAAKEAAKPLRCLKPQSSSDEFLFGDPVKEAASASAASLQKAVFQIEKAVDAELDTWQKLPAKQDLHASPLEFWRCNQTFLPCLASVARATLAMPASSATLERLFSGASRGVCKRRPRLKTRNAQSLIFGHANVLLGYGSKLD